MVKEIKAEKIQEETPVEMHHRELIESIAGNISSLALAVSKLLNGQLNRKALVILLSHSSGQPQNRVEEILKAIENLKRDWLNK